MSEPFGVYLENPLPRRGRGGRFVKSRRRRKTSRRRRRASSSRRRRTSRRRRRNPALMTNPRRRRRVRSHRRRSSSRRRRTSRRRRSYRRNPFRLSSLGGGNVKRTLFEGLGLAGGELVGDALSRVAVKFGAAKLFDMVKVPTNARVPLLRIALGLFAGKLLKVARLPHAITSGFGAVNVAAGVLALTQGMRSSVMARVGLGDYELADVLVGDDGMGDVLVGLSDYELADYELAGDPEESLVLAGDFSDQDYYAGYESRR